MKEFILIAVIVLIIVVGSFFGYKYFFSQPTEAPAPQVNLNNNMNSNPKVEVTILKEGTGKVAKAGDKVTVNYTGTLENGTKFDSSLDRNEPFPFVLGIGQVIKGWDQGLVGVKEGSKVKLVIPAELAYGSDSPSDKIPPNSNLIFEIEVLKVEI